MKKLLICLAFAATLLSLTAKDKKSDKEKDENTGPGITLRDRIEMGGGFIVPDTAKVDDSNKIIESETAPAASAASAPAYDAANDIARMVENACKLGAFIVRQPFSAYQDEKRIDRKSLDYLGQTYSIAYNVEGGYLFTNEALNPWLYDTQNIEILRKQLNKKGGDTNFDLKLNGNTQCSFLNDHPSYGIVSFDSEEAGNVYPGLLYSMKDSSGAFEDGFIPTREEGNLEGYIVYFMKKDNNQDFEKNSSMQVVAMRKPVTVSEKLDEVIPLNGNFDNLMGALYVVPEVTGIGKVSFYLYGVGIRQADGKWGLIFPFEDSDKIFDREQAIKITESAPAEEEINIDDDIFSTVTITKPTDPKDTGDTGTTDERSEEERNGE